MVLKNMSLRWFYFVILVGLLSCNKTKNVELQYPDAQRYFPLNVGDFVVYDVIDTTYLFGNSKEGKKYQLKVKIAEKLVDKSVLAKYTIERYKRNSTTDSWTLDSLWFVSYSNQKEIIMYEANKPFVKLISPIKSSTEWNGNKYNTLNEELYAYKNIEKPYPSASYSLFDSTVTVMQNQDFDNAIGYSYKYEVYAKNIGLIYKYFNEYRYSQQDSIINKNEKVGLFRVMRYVENGNE